MTRTAALVLALLICTACSPGSSPETGSQTNWLRACESSRECGDLECICGACTAPCGGAAACSALPGATCVSASDEGSIALCGGRAAPRAMCLPRCAETCGEGTSCVAGVCAPAGAPTVRVTIDDGERHQTLTGFGASLAYADDAIVAHPDKAALYDLVFAESGLDVLRVRNRHGSAGQDALLPAREIVAAAAERIGRPPFLFMTAGSPPAALKANGSRTCGGDPQTCTLVSLPGAGFDYAGFAEHWRASLAAYASAGITPDYVSIQNNPNWVPPSAAPNDACRFLPEEGRATVTVGARAVEVAYPGYREALAAVRAATADLPVQPRFAAPEVSAPEAVSAFVAALEPSAFDALAVHLYGMDASAVAAAPLATVGELADQLDRPLFQTEMQADGLETSVLIHHALTAAGASAYVQNDLVSLTAEMADVALALLTEDGFEPQGPFYALSQFAKRTDPGWVRLGAAVDATLDAAAGASELLGSAWLSPDASALTVVLINPGTEALTVELALPAELSGSALHSEVTRTVFAGLERSAVLGELPPSRTVQLPSGSILTVSLTAQ